MKNCLQVTECISGRLIIITAIAGVTILAAALVTMALDPIQLLINYNTRVTNNSFMFNMFQKEVDGAHLSLYVFNVTNAQEFMTGEDHSLNVQEVGPFTYAEIRQNIDIDLDEEAGELEFTPNMKLRFVPEQSVARPEDVIVTVPNLALLSVASLVSSLPFFIRNTFKLLFSTLNCKSITTIDVYSFLWGYSDPLISQAYNIVPGIVYFDKFGIMDRLYDNKTIYRMRVGIRDEDRFSIKTLKKYMKSDNWMNERALESYKYKNTYEGAAYPPGLNVETPINIYRLGVCRELNLEFHGTKNMEYGGDAWIYRISNETFNRDCGAGVCGMMDLSSCTYGIPITMSRTHFLDTDPKIYERIKGINPDPSKHDSHFLLEPNIGISLSTSLSLQMNMNLADLRFSDKTEMFSDLVLPVAYIKVVQQDVFDTLNGILRTIHVTAPITLISIEVTMFLIAVAILAYSGLLLYRRSKCKAKKKAYAKLNLRQNLPLIQCQLKKT
ncbi:scavenger receptor class B member 1-like isoform X2 [Bombyx mandarina]|uniref:Scavenger receptor class B member 1 n=1 Tax=Bombyx mandarina TaxID=7092 RepID=A0A6J2KLB5_BOMMA|nr:scavenger receptor class B member 1-like isoform X2 [Bombyx mandarina]